MDDTEREIRELICDTCLKITGVIKCISHDPPEEACNFCLTRADKLYKSFKRKLEEGK